MLAAAKIVLHAKVEVNQIHVLVVNKTSIFLVLFVFRVVLKDVFSVLLVLLVLSAKKVLLSLRIPK